MNDDADEVACPAACRPLFANQPPGITGGALADLVAIWLTSHVAKQPYKTESLRERLPGSHIAVMTRFTEVNVHLLGIVTPQQRRRRQ